MMPVKEEEDVFGSPPPPAVGREGSGEMVVKI